MTSTLTEQLQQLAAEIDANHLGAKSTLTLFPTGGAMLDVRREDGRVFTMAYAPDRGFGIDELHADDGFITSYEHHTTEFDFAACKLRELVFASVDNPQPTAPTLSLVVVYAENIEATREFYSLLGLTFKDERHGNGPNHYSASLGDAVFEIYPLQDGDLVGSLRLGFGVASVDRTVETLKQRRVKIVTEPRDSPWGRRAVVADPNGNRVELTQRP